MWDTKTFKTREAMERWLKKHDGLIEYEEIFVCNAYGIIYRKLRWIG